MEEIVLNSIEEAIEAIKNGEIIIVVDDENRENEGDFIAAADVINPKDDKFYGHSWKRTHLRTLD